ncbi:NHLP bacteriocin export ABC transporter permease/ATPase subunit [Novispirillum sp. DQ9]|uniref:NHLP bacteriocin export ABC transporter permease/ATPase subunit n=1 Tax=Novispirillum sp. DQ9 TaxID=3398612 RepID=UPI003C7E5B4B
MTKPLDAALRLDSQPLTVVRRGSVDLFAVVRQDDGDGRRLFLCRVAAGGWLLPPPSAPGRWEVRAVPGLGAELEDAAATLATLPADARDGWVATLADGLAEGTEGTVADLVMAEGRHRLTHGLRSGGSGRLPRWGRVLSGRFTLRGAAEAVIAPGAPPVPLSRALWLECVEPGEIEVLDDLPAADTAAALAAFHGHAAALVDTILARRAAQTTERLARAGDLGRRLREDGLLTLASVADPAMARAATAPSALGLPAPGLPALCILAARLGLTLKPAPDDDGGLTGVLKTSGIRWRTVLLRGDWWRRDAGPLLAWWQKDDEADAAAAVALLPVAGGYEVHDPVAGTVRRVDEAVADALKGQARMLYRRMPDTPLALADLVRFGLRDAGTPLRRLSLVGLLTALLALSVPFGTNLLVEEVIPRGMVDQHWILVGGLLAAALGTGAFQLVRALLTVAIEGRLDWSLQAGLFDRLLRMAPGFFSAFTAGDLADRVLGIQAMREKLSGAALTALQSLAFSLLSLGALFFFDVKLAIVGVLLAVASLAVTVGLAAMQLRHEDAQADARGRVEGLTFQILAGIGKLKAAAAEDRAFGAWARLYAAQKRHFVAASRVSNRTSVFHAAFPPLSTAILLAVAMMLVKDGVIDGKIQALAGGDADEAAAGLTAGAVMAFLAAFGQFQAALNGVGRSLTDVLGAIPMYRRARPVLAATPEESGPRRQPGDLRGGVEIANLTFGYDAGGAPLFRDLSLTIEPGEWVAFVGPSGSGKSTLLRLLLGFERPQGGEVFLDGIPLADLDLAAVRRQTGVVLQNGAVSGGTVLSNIVGATGLGLDDAWTAARLVGLDADIEAMPMGMHTPLMDGGGTLSGGQRQRLLLARAMIRRPRLLVLDEATSALDNRTQAVVTDTLASLPVTRIVIAHRLSSVERAGRIIVLKDGGIVQQGTYADLIAAPGPFADMARRQTL